MGFHSIIPGGVTSRRHRCGSSVAVSLFILLVIQQLYFPVASQTTQLQGSCAALCDEQRPKGHRQSFKFRCETFSSEDERKKCKESCESCPKEVCDETSEHNDRFEWHCPSVHLMGKCETICTDNRPKGIRESYLLDCDDKTDPNKCPPACSSSDCPKFVCDEQVKNRYHCPYEPFEGPCREECDKIRATVDPSTKDLTYMTPFELKCDVQYGSNPTAQQACKNACQTDCPNWVCDSGVSTNEYSCPSAEVQSHCKIHCDYKRVPHDSSPYVQTCLFCATECPFCSTPAGINFVCDPKATNQIFLCPPKEPDNSIPLSPYLSYKGICKDLCESNRGGGWNSYKLECSKRYDTIQEQQSCEADCKQCPPTGRKCESGSPHWIECRGVERELDKERLEREKEAAQRKNEILNNRKEQSGDIIQTFVFLSSILLIVLLIAIGFVVKTARRPRRGAHFTAPQLNQRPQQSAVVTTPTPQETPIESVARVGQGPT